MMTMTTTATTTTTTTAAAAATIVTTAAAMCIGPLSLAVDKMSKLQCIDAHVMIDALAYVIGSEEKEFCTPCIVALALILKTAMSVLGSKDKVCVNS